MRERFLKEKGLGLNLDQIPLLMKGVTRTCAVAELWIFEVARFTFAATVVIGTGDLAVFTYCNDKIKGELRKINLFYIFCFFVR